MKSLLLSFLILLYIRVFQSYSLVPICCHKGETEENCKSRVYTGTLFDEKSELLPAYPCLVDIKYECHDTDIRTHEPSGKFTFKGVSYNKDEYCFNDKEQFCKFKCRIPICCSKSLENLECIKNYSAEDGTIVIPNNSITTGKTTECPGNTVEICINDTQVTVQNNEIILKDASANMNNYCIYILNSEDKCEQRCWKYSNISYPITICCSYEGDVEKCINHFQNISILSLVKFYMENITHLEDKVCSDEKSLSLSDKGLQIGNELRTDKFCVESISDIDNFCVKLNKENEMKSHSENRPPQIIGRSVSIIFLFLTLIISGLVWEYDTLEKVLYVACLMVAYIMLILYTKNTSHLVLYFLYALFLSCSELILGCIYLKFYCSKIEHKWLIFFVYCIGAIVLTIIEIVYAIKNIHRVTITRDTLILRSCITTFCTCFFILTIIKIKKGSFDHFYKRTYGPLLIARFFDIAINIISIYLESNLFTPLWLWYFMDLCHAVYGVFIFHFFVGNKHSYRLLKWKWANISSRKDQKFLLTRK